MSIENPRQYDSDAEEIAALLMRAELIERQTASLENNAPLRNLLHAMPTILFVLNAARQVVFTNRPLAGTLGIGDLEQVHGLYPGVRFECLHAFEQSGGCGRNSFCATCGKAPDETVAVSRGRVAPECFFLRRTNPDDTDLRVTAAAIELSGKEYTLYNVSDTGHEKRRRSLERIFFHDVLNVASGLRVAGEVMPHLQGAERQRIEQTIQRLSRRLVDEIQAQRDLVSAEKGDLLPQMKTCDAAEALEEIVDAYSRHTLAQSRTLKLVTPDDPAKIMSDPVILGRIIGNMVKNGLEASPAGTTVTASLRPSRDHLIYSVHNEGAMSEEVQRQVFRRSFSTKGAGRGLGTYSVKLLGERYLGGRVWFESRDPDGTTFFLQLPVHKEVQATTTEPAAEPACAGV